MHVSNTYDTAARLKWYPKTDTAAGCAIDHQLRSYVYVYPNMYAVTTLSLQLQMESWNIRIITNCNVSRLSMMNDRYLGLICRPSSQGQEAMMSMAHTGGSIRKWPVNAHNSVRVDRYTCTCQHRYWCQKIRLRRSSGCHGLLAGKSLHHPSWSAIHCLWPSSTRLPAAAPVFAARTTGRPNFNAAFVQWTVRLGLWIFVIRPWQESINCDYTPEYCN